MNLAAGLRTRTAPEKSLRLPVVALGVFMNLHCS